MRLTGGEGGMDDRGTETVEEEGTFIEDELDAQQVIIGMF